MSAIEEDQKQKYAANTEGENYDQPTVQATVEPVAVVGAIPVENVVYNGGDNTSRSPSTASVIKDEIKIPDHFLKLACMACTCSNCDWPSCFGGKSSGTFLCVEGSGVCCKPIEDKKDCFICWAGENEIVVPRTCCKMYEQCFCFECFMALPSVEEGYKNTPIAMVTMPSRTDGTHVMNDVVILSGACCSIDSCNCKVPECLGCYTKNVCLCCESECIEYKLMCWEKNKVKEDTLCISRKGNCTLIRPYTCCKGISQQCCCDRRFACPCDDDVPCVYSLLPFCTCCVNGECNVACCATINDVLKKGKQPLMQQQYNNNQQYNNQGQQQFNNGQQQQFNNGQNPQVVTAQPM